MNEPIDSPNRPPRERADIFAFRGLGILAGVLTLAVCVAADVVLDHEAAAIVGTYVAAPFITALLAGPASTAVVGILAVACGALSQRWNMNTEGPDQLVRIAVILLGSGFAVAGSWVRTRSHSRSRRLALLDSVGAVADGSLPLSETLREVIEVVVPEFADICMVDAVHEGRATRLAVRARGREDAEAIEEGLRRRKPSLPAWLVDVQRPWRQIPRWLPRMTDEDLRRMADGPEDLGFLRSIGVRSSISTPIRARDTNLGVLTVISAWSKRRYSAEDVKFNQILAGRIGLALDNAGLFSDLESVERRMDTVMSILDEAVVIHGPDGELLFANPAAAHSLGFETSEEAMPTQAARIRERFLIRDEAGRELGSESLSGRDALGGFSPTPLTLRATERSSGRERWFRVKAQTIEGPRGDVLYSVTAIEDVTEVKRAEFMSSLLARTGELLSDSVDYRRTLERVPELLVPDFADWCSVELPGANGTVERVAMAHRDPERGERLATVREPFPVGDEGASPMVRALETGEAQLVTVDPELLQRLATSAAHLAALEAMDMGSVIVAPMVAGGTAVGALTFVNHREARRFDPEDVEVAAEIARRAGLAIENARISEERVKIADQLQRELLPPSVPAMPGWEVATMYEAAGEINEVGGDFYEVFRVEDGWAVVLGDVSGKGAAAAALTAEARHTIRTAGAVSSDPRSGLYLLDENLRGRDDAALCSVAMLLLPESGLGRSAVVIHLAGHPHPILLRGGRAETVGEPGPLLGVSAEPNWPATEVELDPGDQLVLYTDGVIEARRDGGERFGTERLRADLAGCESPELAVARVRSSLSRFGARAREDDAALVVIRRGRPPSTRLRPQARRRPAPASPRS